MMLTARARTGPLFSTLKRQTPSPRLAPRISSQPSQCRISSFWRRSPPGGAQPPPPPPPPYWPPMPTGGFHEPYGYNPPIPYYDPNAPPPAPPPYQPQPPRQGPHRWRRWLFGGLAVAAAVYMVSNSRVIVVGGGDGRYGYMDDDFGPMSWDDVLLRLAPSFAAERYPNFLSPNEFRPFRIVAIDRSNPHSLVQILRLRPESLCGETVTDVATSAESIGGADAGAGSINSSNTNGSNGSNGSSSSNSNGGDGDVDGDGDSNSNGWGGARSSTVWGWRWSKRTGWIGCSSSSTGGSPLPPLMDGFGVPVSLDGYANYGTAWGRMFWHVEIMQPEVQVIREYTPLACGIEDVHARGIAAAENYRLALDENPAYHVKKSQAARQLLDDMSHPATKPHVQRILAMENASASKADLLFAIRPREDGLVSRYLVSLPVGATVYLRGPGWGFDLRQRLMNLGFNSDTPPLAEGAAAYDDEWEALECPQEVVIPAFRSGERPEPGEIDEYRVICITAGTGMAALTQYLAFVRWFIAARPRQSRLRSALISCGHLADVAESYENSSRRGNSKAEWDGDVLQRQQRQQPARSLLFRALDIMRDLQSFTGADEMSLTRFHGSEDQIPYNHTHSFPEALERLLLKEPVDRSLKVKPIPPTNPKCHFHSSEVLERSPEFDDPYDQSLMCSCPVDPHSTSAPRKHIVIVSGPPAFVDKVAGPKYWASGKQRQGPVAGILGDIAKKHPGILDDWLVLKM